MQPPMVTILEQIQGVSALGQVVVTQVRAHVGIALCAEARPAARTIAAIEKDFMMLCVKENCQAQTCGKDGR